MGGEDTLGGPGSACSLENCIQTRFWVGALISIASQFLLGLQLEGHGCLCTSVSSRLDVRLEKRISPRLFLMCCLTAIEESKKTRPGCSLCCRHTKKKPEQVQLRVCMSVWASFIKAFLQSRCRRRQNKAAMKGEVDHLKHCVVCNLEHVLQELLKSGDSLRPWV